MPSLQLWIGAGLLGLLIVSGSLNACQHRTIGNLRSELGSTRAKLDTAVSANQSQSDAIGRLEESQRQWEQECTLSADIKTQAAQAVEFRSRIQSLSGELAKVKANASPSCKALLETDFGAACPDILGVMRERAANR